MVARLPEQECIWPRLTGMCRAHHVAMVPESQVTMAFAGRRLPNFVGHNLRLHRLAPSAPRVRPSACAIPSSPSCAVVEEAAVLVSAAAAASALRSVAAAIADQADFDGIA